MRQLRYGVGLFFFLLLSVTQMPAQSTSSTCSSGKASTLYCMPITSTENAFVFPSLPSQGLVPIEGFYPVTSAIGTQLSTFPTPSPSSSLIFSFGAGGLTAAQQLGPIYSDAPWSIGRHKLYLAFAYQFLEFDKVDNVSLSSIPLVLNACIGSSAAGSVCTQPPLIQTMSHYTVNLNEYLSYASFGLTNRIDISVTIPMVNVRSTMTTTCSVCTSSFSDGIHALFFTPNTSHGASTGIGDVVFGVKGVVLEGERGALAAGVDVRAPTGYAYNYQGAGTTGVHPYLALGYRGRVAPHINVGGWINGDSVLASTNGTTEQHLPDSLVYDAGADISALRWLSFTGDYVGQTYFDAGRLAINQSATQLQTSNQTFNTNTIALGFKTMPAHGLLLTANVLIKAGNGGLDYKPVPMIGISYTF
jgi:hypothetical protein